MCICVCIQKVNIFADFTRPSRNKLLFFHCDAKQCLFSLATNTTLAPRTGLPDLMANYRKKCLFGLATSITLVPRPGLPDFGPGPTL